MDFSTALCDARGEMVAQGLCLPLQMGTIPDALEACMNKFRGREKPGDIYILNDPYAGGTHLPDIFVIKPIFALGKLFAYACTVAHHIDVGGRVAGGNAFDSTEIYQEGLRIPPSKLYQEGEENEALFDLIRQNVRLPEMVVGDLRAQVAACERGERELLELTQRYGLDQMRSYLLDLCDYSEEITRRELSQLPDGEFEFIDFIDDDGIDEGPIRIQVKLTKRGDELTADFTGTSPQVRGAINPTFSFTKSAVYACVRCVLSPTIPNNGGFFRPLRIFAPPGSFVNALPPAAVAARGLAGFRMVDTVFGALAQMLPDRIPACGVQGDTGVSIGGYQSDGTPFVFMEFSFGSWGGGPDRDGMDACAGLAVNIANISAEAIEAEQPLLVEQYGYVADSGGPGQFRGGLALVRDYRLVGVDEAVLNVRSDRRKHPPFGLWGGKPGMPSANWLYSEKEDGGQMPSKFLSPLRSGDVIRVRLAGGGGWGDPLERDPQSVLKDAINEKITVDHARSAYGVVLDGAPLEVDPEGTKALRRTLRAER